MNNINITKEDSKVVLEIGCEKVAFLKVANEGFGSYRIENIEIDEEYRGRGFYKMLLIAAFNIFGIDTLRSDNRNHNSNPIYCKWTNSDISGDDQVYIQLCGESLEFTVNND